VCIDHRTCVVSFNLGVQKGCGAWVSPWAARPINQAVVVMLVALVLCGARCSAPPVAGGQLCSPDVRASLAVASGGVGLLAFLHHCWSVMHTM
jgi:hypothetical protein